MLLLIVALAGLAGAAVFGLLFAFLGLKGHSVKLPVIGMAACSLVVIVIGVLSFLGIGVPDHSSADGGQSVGEDGASKPKSDVPAGEEEVSEQVLLDESGIVITAEGIERKGTFGANLKILIENNSEADVTVQARNSSVNGYMVDTMFSCTVAAGKKANDSITFLSSDLEACDIETIADMEFSFHIFNDSWETVLDSDLVKVNTSAAETYTYGFDDSGSELHNENGVRIISKGFSDDQSIFGPGLVLFIENTTGKDVTVQVRDVSVNGFMVDTMFSEDVTADKCAVTAITVMSSSLEENGIDKIEEMEFYFHVFESDSWATIFDTDKVVVSA